MHNNGNKRIKKIKKKQKISQHITTMMNKNTMQQNDDMFSTNKIQQRGRVLRMQALQQMQ